MQWITKWFGVGAFSILSTLTAAEPIDVTVSAVGVDREAAIQNGLGDALKDALGTQVFVVSSMSDDQLHSASTAITSGRINDYAIVDERSVHEGVFVTLNVTLDSNSLGSDNRQYVTTWSERIDQTATLTLAQDIVGNYRSALQEFLVGPKHQLNAGYAFVLRSYEVTDIGPDSLAGFVLVDIVVNESWWDTYYQLVGSMTAQGATTIQEGPVTVVGDDARVNWGIRSKIDRSLQYDLAHPLPVVLTVGDTKSRFLLYKNALLDSAQPMTHDTAQTDHQIAQAERGSISMLKGNVHAGDVMVDEDKSDLRCGSTSSSNAVVYCGTRFTVAIPFDAENEAEIIDMMNRGLNYNLDLFGLRDEARKIDDTPSQAELIMELRSQ